MSRGMFVDLSQWNAATLDWPAYKQWSASGDGMARVALRSSYGNGYKDASYQTYRAGAQAAGIDVIIHYHYAYPQNNTPLAEANWMAKVVGSIGANDVIMLDYEENVPQTNAQWAYEWLTQQQQNYPNNQVIIYASSSFVASHLQDARLAQFPLVLANWQYDPNETPACPAPWQAYTYLQYTDKAQNIPGIPGAVDANVFVGVSPSMPEKPLDITEVSSWFVQLSPTQWQAIDQKSGKPATDTSGQPLVYRDGILSYIRSGRASDAQYGNFTRYGLPVENEHSPMSGVAIQRAERGVIQWEPAHVIDNPPGASACYGAHLDTIYVAADALGPTRDQLNATQTQLTQAQTTLKATGQQLAQTQAALSASTGGQYGLAVNDITARVKGLPPYPTTIPQGGLSDEH